MFENDKNLNTSILKSFQIPFILIGGTIVVGTIGFELIEGWDFLTSLYMTVITLSTVGYGEVGHLSDNGRILVMILIAFGIGVFGYTIGTITKYIVDGELKNTFKRKKMMRQIESLREHFILCGYGRTGKQVALELVKAKKEFIVIDLYSEGFPENPPFPYIIGNATEDEILLEAGIKRANGLIACLKDDSDNIFVTLSARQLNKEINIISRCLDEKTESKLYKAGANKVILPLIQVGKRLARMMLNPGITSFLDIVSDDEEVDLTLDELAVKENSELDGKKILNSGIRDKTNGMIIAIKKADGKLSMNPTVHEEINKGDVLVVLIESNQIDKLQKMAGHFN